MFLLLFNLIQSQQARLSPLVIAAAVFAFVIGIALLVYFFRRLKTSEKEAEEDWSISHRSLFVNPEPDEQKSEEVVVAEPARPELINPEPVNLEPINLEPINQAATEELTSLRTGEIHEVANEQVKGTEELRAEYLPELDMTPAEAPAREERPTQVLASIQPEDSGKEAEAIDESTPFDDEVWAGLETDKQQSAPPAPPAESGRGTELLGSDQLWPAIEWPSVEQ